GILGRPCTPTHQAVRCESSASPLAVGLDQFLAAPNPVEHASAFRIVLGVVEPVRAPQRFDLMTMIETLCRAPHEDVRSVHITEDKDGVQAELSNGRTVRARFLLGAHGSNSQITR